MYMLICVDLFVLLFWVWWVCGFEVSMTGFFRFCFNGVCPECGLCFGF